MSNRAGIQKNTNKIRIIKPKQKEGEFYFCSFVVDDNCRFKAVTDLTDKDIITKTNRKVKNPKVIALKIEKTWQTL